MKKQCLCLNCLNSKIMIIGLCVELQIATEFAKLLRERKDCGDFTFSFFPDSEWHKIQIKRTLKNLDLL